MTLFELAMAMDSFEFSEDLGKYIGELKGEVHTLNDHQFKIMHSTARGLILGEINKARDASTEIEATYRLTKKTNRKHFLTSALLTYWYEIEDPGEELANQLAGARYYANQSEAALNTNDFIVANELVELGKETVRGAGYAFEDYRSALINNAGDAMEFAESVRRFSVNGMIGTGAVLVAPAAVASFGLLGGGTAVIGTGTLVGGGVEAEMSIAKQVMAGEGIDPLEVTGSGITGAKSGLVSSATGFVGGATASSFGPGASLLRVGSVSGGASGATGRGLGALVEGESIGVVLGESVRGAWEGAIAGLIGGATSRFISVHNLSLAARVVVGAGGGMTAGGVGALAAGRSPEEIAQSALMGLFLGAAEGLDTPASRGLIPQKSTGSPPPGQRPPWTRIGDDPDYGIILVKSGDDIVGVHADYPYTVFFPQGPKTPRVFTGRPGGPVTEIPWPFSKRLTAGPDQSGAPESSIRPTAPSEQPSRVNTPERVGTTRAANVRSSTDDIVQGEVHKVEPAISETSSLDSRSRPRTAEVSTRDRTVEELLNETIDIQPLVVRTAESARGHAATRPEIGTDLASAPVSTTDQAASVPSTARANVAQGALRSAGVYELTENDRLGDAEHTVLLHNLLTNFETWVVDPVRRRARLSDGTHVASIRGPRRGGAATAIHEINIISAGGSRVQLYVKVELVRVGEGDGLHGEHTGPARLELSREPDVPTSWRARIEIDPRLSMEDAETALRHEVREAVRIVRRIGASRDLQEGEVAERVATEQQAAAYRPDSTGEFTRLTDHDYSADEELIELFERYENMPEENGARDAARERLNRMLYIMGFQLRNPTLMQYREEVLGDFGAVGQRLLAYVEVWYPTTPVQVERADFEYFDKKQNRIVLVPNRGYVANIQELRRLALQMAISYTEVRDQQNNVLTAGVPLGRWTPQGGKPFWYSPDREWELELEEVGHLKQRGPNLPREGEGPHVMIRRRNADGKYQQVDKIFIVNQDWIQTR